MLPMQSMVRVIFLASILTTTAAAQTVYIDFEPGPIQLPNGPPSSSYGGAAGVAGVWNAKQMSLTPTPLVDIHGQPTQLTFTASGCGADGCCGVWCCLGVDTDATKLMGDYYLCDCFQSLTSVTISGVEPGTYRLYLYGGGYSANLQGSVG